MGGNGGPKKGGGKGDASKFAKTALSWFCKPCNWRNQAGAAYCCKCGKAKQWVQDRNRAPEDPQAAALKEKTDELRKEFNKALNELKSGGKGDPHFGKRWWRCV